MDFIPTRGKWVTYFFFPESARAHFSLAQTLVQAQAPDLAIPHFREALRLLPSDTDPGLDADVRRRIEQVANERLNDNRGGPTR